MRQPFTSHRRLRLRQRIRLPQQSVPSIVRSQPHPAFSGGRDGGHGHNGGKGRFTGPQFHQFGFHIFI